MPKTVKSKTTSKVATPKKTAATVDVHEKVLDHLEKLLQRLNFDVEIESNVDPDNNLLITLKSPDSSLLIGRHGENLDSLQTILHTILFKAIVAEELPNVVLDVDGWRQKRIAELEELAAKIAQKVKFSGKPQGLSNLKPFERRVIHLTLENNPDVQSTSEGEGRFRKLVVSLRQK